MKIKINCINFRFSRNFSVVDTFKMRFQNCDASFQNCAEKNSNSLFSKIYKIQYQKQSTLQNVVITANR